MLLAIVAKFVLDVAIDVVWRLVQSESKQTDLTGAFVFCFVIPIVVAAVVPFVAF